MSPPSFPITVPANGYATFSFAFEYTMFPDRTVTFCLHETSGSCELQVPVTVDWEECVGKDCEAKYIDLHFRPDLSTPHQISFFEIAFFLPGASQVVACWSEPNKVLYNSYNASSQIDDVLYMIDYGLLSQLAAEGKEICFHFILCIKGNYLCHAEYCIPASDLLAIADSYQSKGMSAPIDAPDSGSAIRLVPNPAEGMVEVVGAERVREITVISMSGERVLEVSNSNAFNAGPLARALYIVSVLAEDGTAHFVKFVRQ